MFPSQGPTGQGGGDLEERLRGLILSNANANSAPGGGQQPLSTPRLPSHILSATPEEQQEYLAKSTSQARPVQSVNSSNIQSPPGGRKRPNQAQRRQMNAQMAFPIDPRPNPAIQGVRGPGSFGAQAHSAWSSPQHNNYQGYQNQRYQNQPPQQQHSPRFPNHGPRDPYSPRMAMPPASPQSQINQYQPSPAQHYQPRQTPNNFQHQHQQTSYGARPLPQSRQLYQPGPYGGQGRGRPLGYNSEDIAGQSVYLEGLLHTCVPKVGIEPEEETDKESFRAEVEMICRTSISEFEQQVLGNERFDASTVEVQCFGSMKSGFATRASDMDLALLSPKSSPAPDSPESRIPRLLEKKLLDLGYGARLLTRTRVPIIKLCQRPTEKLLSDLLEERAKWENGFAADAEGDEEDLNEAEIPIQKQRAAKRKRSQNQISPETSASVPVKSQTESYQEKLSLLKQKEHQPLGDYYNSAKRLLRKLGGRDLSASSPDLDEPESKVLNDICKAFVLGLSSDALSTRLRNYQSISPLFNASLPSVQRSLHGVWIQIEGERLALAWESRPIIEANDKHEFECLNAVEAWRALQDKNGPLTEPSLYNRQLFAASEKLKKISSLQLVFLEQLQHEEPTYYYARTQRIKEDLRSTGVSEDSDSVTPIIMAHYVSGVRDQQIQECLQAFNGKTLQNVALEHRKLQLAVDYEHALKLDLFDQGDVPDVERYISLLRTHSTEQLAVFQAQQTSGALELTRLAVKMRTLPDPTQISPLKPRDRYNDHLEFPKSGIGIQCDINFSAHLAIHNTLLLRCYSHSDSRVKQLILFVKHWAKVRGINTPYRGTLSSYGYVLMVLHYLVNVVQPFVCPNLQAIHRDQPSYLPPAEIEARTTCNGRDVRFWRNEAEIKDLAARKMLNHNHDSVGVLLRGFFEYYAQNGPMTTVQHRSFDWGREALSLRTHGGILSKQEKGWVGAKTVVETTTIAAPPTPTKEGATNVNAEASNTTVEGDTPDAKAKHHVKTMEETKEIRHRYLFAIEDPFEVDHNVARTVTHNGIVSIRDEFRRAWRIIRSAGKGHEKEGLLDPLPSGTDAKAGLQELLTMIHGQASKVEVQVAVQAA